MPDDVQHKIIELVSTAVECRDQYMN